MHQLAAKAERKRCLAAVGERVKPLFCQAHAPVSYYATEKIASFLQRRGLNPKLRHHVMFLFLMEMSVQDYLALGRSTELDQICAEVAGCHPEAVAGDGTRA